MTAHPTAEGCTSEQISPLTLAWSERWLDTTTAIAAAPRLPHVDEVALAWTERALADARRIEAIINHPSYDPGTCPLCFGDHSLDDCLTGPMRCVDCGADLADDNTTDLCAGCEATP